MATIADPLPLRHGCHIRTAPDVIGDLGGGVRRESMAMVGRDVHGTRPKLGRMVPRFALAVVTAGAIWLACLILPPPVSGVRGPVERLTFGLPCAVVALLLTSLLGVEAVVHGRLATDAFAPLAGRESRRLRVNARCLQNALEQAVLFVPALLASAIAGKDGRAARRRGRDGGVRDGAIGSMDWLPPLSSTPRVRPGRIGAGDADHALRLRWFGRDLAGPVGVAVPVALFAAGEVAILMDLRRR